VIPYQQKRSCLENRDSTPKQSSQQTESWFMIEVSAHLKALAGNYSANLFIGNQKYPFDIRIWRMEMPSQFSLPLYSELTPWFLSLGHFGKWDKSEPELTKKYVKSMVAHRVIPLKTWIRFPSITDFEKTHRFSFETFPSKESSYKNTVIDNVPTWAQLTMPFPEESKNLSTARKWWAALEGVVRNENLQSRSITYLWDEPSPKDFPKMRLLAREVGIAAPSVRRLVTAYPTTDLLPLVEIFAPLVGQLNGRESPRLKRSNQELWAYVSCVSHGCGNDISSGEPDFIIERNASYIRSISHIAALYNLKSFLYYSVNNGYKDFPKRDPWDSLFDFSGNGDGTLFYPGRPGKYGFSEHSPVPSLRLKIWRDTSFDAEYIRWMEESPTKPAWWESRKLAIRKNSFLWSKNVDDYEALRTEMGNYIDAQWQRNRP
jgi:hypothetical protein